MQTGARRRHNEIIEAFIDYARRPEQFERLNEFLLIRPGKCLSETTRAPESAHYYFIASLFASAQLAPIIAITQTLMPASMRAVSSAVLLLLVNLIGTGAGAFTAGLLSDALTSQYGDEGIRYAVGLTQAAAVVGASVIVWAAWRLPHQYPPLFSRHI